MTPQIYETYAPAFGVWGPWTIVDFTATGSQPIPFRLRAFQIDKMSKALFDGQLHWFENENDAQPHLTTFYDGWINVQLPPNVLQQPRVRFTNHGIFGMQLRVVVNALIVLPGYDVPRPKDKLIPRGVEPPRMDAATMARSRALRG